MIEMYTAGIWVYAVATMGVLLIIVGAFFTPFLWFEGKSVVSITTFLIGFMGIAIVTYAFSLEQDQLKKTVPSLEEAYGVTLSGVTPEKGFLSSKPVSRGTSDVVITFAGEEVKHEGLLVVEDSFASLVIKDGSVLIPVEEFVGN